MLIDQLLNLWERESITNAPFVYDESAVAARYWLPVAVEHWGYPRDVFFRPEAQFAVSPADDDQLSRTENYLADGLKDRLRSEKTLDLRPDLRLFLLRACLLGEEVAIARRKAIAYSREHPDHVVVLTSFSTLDIYAGGALVRQYGLRDWERRFDELTTIFHTAQHQIPHPLDAEEETSRFAAALREMYPLLHEEFAARSGTKTLSEDNRNPAVSAVQALAYLVFLRFLEARYPFTRRQLSRCYYGYLDERQAYGDPNLSGHIWVDINRVIRDMGEGKTLDTFISYKFPDQTLRHKLWKMTVSNEALTAILRSLITERFGVLRTPYFGALFGRLHHKVRPDADLDTDATSSLWVALHAEEDPRPVSLSELRTLLDGFFTGQLQPAFARRDARAFRKAADGLLNLRVIERHTNGAILLAHAAALLLDIHGRAEALRHQWLMESQEKTQTLFGDPEVTELGRGCGTVWDIRKQHLRPHYQTPVDTELAEIALNVLSIVRADESATYPNLVRTLNLEHLSLSESP